MQSDNRSARWLAATLPALLCAFFLTAMCTFAPEATFGQTEDSEDPDSTEAEVVEDDSSLVEDDDDEWEWSDEPYYRSGDVVRMGEDVEIDPNQTVGGDCVAIGGDVTIWGHAQGDVVAVGGSVYVKDGAVVDGDAVSVGGEVEREEGGIIHGQEVQVGGFPLNLSRWFAGGPTVRYSHTGFQALTIWREFLAYLGIFLIGLIFVLAFPDRSLVIRETFKSNFWLSLVGGFGSFLGVIVLIVLLCITCIGVVVAVPGIFVFILALLASYALGASILGEVISKRPIPNNKAMLSTMLIGLLTLFAVLLIGRLLMLAGGVGDPIGDSLVGIVWVAWFVLAMTGFGAMVLSRFGKRVPGVVAATPPPATQQPPAVPPEITPPPPPPQAPPQPPHSPPPPPPANP